MGARCVGGLAGGVASGAVAAWIGAAAAGPTVDFSDASSSAKLESRVGVGIEQDGFALGADVKLVGQDGRTEVLPQVTSGWSGPGGLDLKTVLSYGDWNLGPAAFRPSVETTLLARPNFAFIDRVTGDVRRSAGGDISSLDFKFSRLDTGWTLFGGSPLDVAADLALQDGAAAAATSTFESSLGVGRALNVTGDLKLTATPLGPPAPVLDTRLVYRVPVAFVDRVEGSAGRDADGEAHGSLSVLFPSLSSRTLERTPFKLSSKATLQQLVLPGGGPAAVSMDFETRVSGVAAPALGGTDALSFVYERRLDADRGARSSLAYDHSWQPAERATIGLDFKIVADPGALAPTMGLHWSAEF